MLDKLIVIVISISCILNQYSGPIASLGLLLSLALTAILLIRNKKIYIDKELLCLVGIIILQQFVCVFYAKLDFISFIKQSGTMILIILVTALSYEITDFKKLYKAMKVVGIIATSAVVIQAIQFYIFHQSVSPIMLFNVGDDLNNWSQSGRPMGFFSEVQVYCSSILPLLAFSILEYDYKVSVFISIGILLSGSSLGILTMGFVWGYYLIKNGSVNRNIKITIFSLGLLTVILFFTLNFFAGAREKVLSIFKEIGTYTSAKMTSTYSYTNYLRLFKAFDTYMAYPLLEKILGTGCINTINYLNQSGIYVNWYSIWNTSDVMSAYYTTGFGIFIECGLIVGLLYYFFFYKKYRHTNQHGKILIVLMIIQGFITQFFFNGLFTYYLLLFYAVTDKQTVNKVKIKIG